MTSAAIDTHAPLEEPAESPFQSAFAAQISRFRRLLSKELGCPHDQLVRRHQRRWIGTLVLARGSSSKRQALATALIPACLCRERAIAGPTEGAPAGLLFQAAVA
jgi:hypothetical protein